MHYPELKLHWRILIALLLAVIVGLTVGRETGVFGVSFYSILDLVGKLFLNALKMLIVPLIVSSIIIGVSGIGASADLGRLGAKTLLYYATTNLSAILIGLALVNLIGPGMVEGDPRTVFGFQGDPAALQAQMAGRDSGDLARLLGGIIPTNIVGAAASGEMLGLIFFSLLYGFFMSRIAKPQAAVQRQFWQGVFDTMMRMTGWVMGFAPLGVFALVARTVAETGLAAFGPLALFFLTVALGLAVHLFLVLPGLLYFVGKVNPLRHFRAMSPALLTAFSTASSSATLPMTLECVEKNAGVSNRTTSFVLPLGASTNMDGTALYECVAVMFIAQAYGIELTLGTQFVIVLLSLFTSMGMAGIPAASLVAIAIILTAVGLPLEGLGLILAVDRILDMLRTTVNVFSDSCGAVVIARTEGETTVLADPVSPPNTAAQTGQDR